MFLLLKQPQQLSKENGLGGENCLYILCFIRNIGQSLNQYFEQCNRFSLFCTILIGNSKFKQLLFSLHTWMTAY